VKYDWSRYAAAYDLMAEMNPAYGDLLADFQRAIAGWKIEPGEVLADFGAGTGNFSVKLAGQFPQCEVRHVDSNAVMNARAAEKARTAGLDNFQVQAADLQEVSFAPGSLAGIVTVHALYTQPDPQGLMRRMNGWLRPGGCAFLCNAGRLMSVADWRKYLLRESLRRHGLRRTVYAFWRGRVVARENAKIAELQRNGTFWTHTTEEFLQAVASAGFTVLDHYTAYRGCSDVVLCRKYAPMDSD
jgi:ubiquinone/menaquinone biosynthesis C-methylase UbiE